MIAFFFIFQFNTFPLISTLIWTRHVSLTYQPCLDIERIEETHTVRDTHTEGDRGDRLRERKGARKNQYETHERIFSMCIQYAHLAYITNSERKKEKNWKETETYHLNRVECWSIFTLVDAVFCFSLFSFHFFFVVTPFWFFFFHFFNLLFLKMWSRGICACFISWYSDLIIFNLIADAFF